MKMWLESGLVFRVLIVAALIKGVVSAKSIQQRLLRDLFDKYYSDAHPKDSSTQPVVVRMSAKIARIITVYEKEKILRTQWWVRLFWNNPDLAWNASEYEGLKVIHVDSNRVWIPDIKLYNNAQDNKDMEQRPKKSRVMISHDGNNTWFYPSQFDSICDLDITHFPFDSQVCILQFGSWAFDDSKLDIQIINETSLHKDYSQNNEWILDECHMKRIKSLYDCCPRPYVNVVVQVHISRRFQSYIVGLVLPCALIACMVFLSFVLPPESGERIGLCITVLMAMALFQELTSQQLPQGSDKIPLLELYYTTAIFEIGIAMCATCIIINFHHRKCKMSGWLRYLVLGKLAPLACLKVDNPPTSPSEPQSKSNGPNKTANGNCTECKDKAARKPSKKCRMHVTVDSQQLEMIECGSSEVPEDTENHEVENSNLLRRKSTRRKRSTLASDIRDWQTAALVLDRIFLFSAIIVGSVSATAIFLQAPRIRDMFKI